MRARTRSGQPSGSMQLGDSHTVLSCFNIVRAHNTGAAFSFLAHAGGWQRWLFTAIAVVISTLVLWWLTRLERALRWAPTALMFILGGAIGNLIDRIAFGYVTDFVDVYVGTWHFWAFNIADAAITVGVALMIFDMMGVASSARNESTPQPGA